MLLFARLSELGKTDAVLHQFWEDRCRVTRGRHVHHVLVVQRSIADRGHEGCLTSHMQDICTVLFFSITRIQTTDILQN